jgi:hypothetical protein
LKDLGVSLGHRPKMLRAIRDLSGASVAATASSAPVAPEPIRQDDAERRQLNVMFTDLVGSTSSTRDHARLITTKPDFSSPGRRQPGSLSALRRPHWAKFTEELTVSDVRDGTSPIWRFLQFDGYRIKINRGCD